MSINTLAGQSFSVKCTSYATPATAATARGSLPNLREQVQRERRYLYAVPDRPGGGGLMPSNEARAVAAAVKWWLIDYLTGAGGRARYMLAAVRYLLSYGKELAEPVEAWLPNYQNREAS